MSLPRYDFAGSVAIVTGAATGIGEAIAARLAEGGATVVGWDLPGVPAGAQIRSGHAQEADVTDRAAIHRALGATLERWGRVDMLVNNAGFAGPTMPLDEFDPQTWQRVVDVNLVGVFNMCHAVVPQLRRQGQGRIVNIASLAGKEGTPNASAYSAAKAGVMALTKSLGKELATTGIRVNAIAPAAVETGLLRQMSPQHVQTMIDKSPMQRLGTPAEVAELTAWLCSDACSFSTGAVFDLSGGRATY